LVSIYLLERSCQNNLPKRAQLARPLYIYYNHKIETRYWVRDIITVRACSKSPIFVQAIYGGGGSSISHDSLVNSVCIMDAILGIKIKFKIVAQDFNEDSRVLLTKRFEAVGESCLAKKDEVLRRMLKLSFDFKCDYSKEITKER
jgi:hypothetical protein